jgi:hypothetical protein
VLRIRFITVLWFSVLCLVVTGCYNSNPPWVDLPKKDNTKFTVSVKTFSDPGTVAQPFKLGVRSSLRSSDVVQIFYAEQCKNVEIFQDTNAIAIFYDELAIHEFAGTNLGNGLPRPLLCDNHYPICQTLKESYKKRGIGSEHVCALH